MHLEDHIPNQDGTKYGSNTLVRAVDTSPNLRIADQIGSNVSYLCYSLNLPRRKQPVREVKLQEYRLKGNRKGALLKEETCIEDGQVVSYSLAYINLRQFAGDNRRVLGYDNSHGYHHRQFIGKVEPVDFSTYADLAERFFKEVHELWRIEDEEE